MVDREFLLALLLLTPYYKNLGSNTNPNLRMLIVLIWWFISAHKWFKGPKINVEHHMLGRDPTIEGVEGIEGVSDSDSPASLNKKIDDGAPVTGLEVR